MVWRRLEQKQLDIWKQSSLLTAQCPIKVEAEPSMPFVPILQNTRTVGSSL